MKKRILSLLLCLTIAIGMFPAFITPVFPKVHAATTSQNNIVARADYLYNIKWTCQKTVSGWRGNYTFYQGSTYRIPYGQPINSGYYVGFGVTVDKFLESTKSAGSVFYTSRSTYGSTYSVYYATDCSAFVSWCWGTGRHTTYSIPQISTYIGMATKANTSKLQLGDALNSNDVGHVVLVTGLTYDASGNLTQIEITEQTPPQLKRSYYTPTELGNKYGTYYGIYRYTGSVPAAPSSPSSSPDSSGSSGSVTGKYYPACDSSYTTFYAAMESIGVSCDWDLHCRIAKANGITDFTGTAEQNTQLLNLLKSGKLLNPDYTAVSYYPACSSSYTTFYAAMESIGVSCDWDLHCRIAAANGITDFSGTAEQNTTLLNLLKAGKLINPDATTSGSSNSSGYQNGYPGGMTGDGTIYAHGLDVSSWQGSDLDFSMIKNAGYDFVILRAGSTKGKDTCFETFYKNAKAAGLDVGAYYYSYATTAAGAKTDADNMLSWISGKQFEYPLYFDYEDASQDDLDTATAKSICLTFMDTLANAGYLTGLYTSYYKSTLLPMDAICAKYEFWVANYLDYTYETLSPSYSTKYGMYQYTNQNYIGTAGPFDADVVYKDYPAIVKKYGFNGYSATATSSYLDKCTFYPAHCQFTTTKEASINSLPCAADTNGSKSLEISDANVTFIAIGMYKNTSGNLWYKIKTGSGEIGYISAGRTAYVQDLTSDIKLTNYSLPNGHVKGNVFYVTGKISASCNQIDTAKVFVCKGFGASGEKSTGGTEAISGNSYLLDNSAVDNATAFGRLGTGKYTYIISVDYTNYYAKASKELGTNSGTKQLKTHYFMVISSAADQSACSHSNSSTVLSEATCTTAGTKLIYCSKCGLVTEKAIEPAHTYKTTTIAPDGSNDGSVTYTCTVCGYNYTEILPTYLTKCTFYPAHCQIKTTKESPINNLPRSAKSSDGSSTLETAQVNTTYTAVGLYLNTSGNYWYQIVTNSGETGYLFSGHTTYMGEVTSDIEFEGYNYPNGHIEGSPFDAAGTISASYNRLDSVALYVHQGFGLTGQQSICATDTVSGKNYALSGSTIAKSADFAGLTIGNYTYAIAVSYTNYYALAAKEMGTNQGVKYLCSDYFAVISNAADQSACVHQYDSTTLTKATCTSNGLSVNSCAVCGLIIHVSTPPAHSFGDWTVTVSPSCTTEGTLTRTCSACPAEETATLPATSHNYINGCCGVCGTADPNYEVPVLKGSSFSLSFEDEILVNFYFTVSNTDSVVEQGMLMFIANPGTASYDTATNVYGSKYVAASNSYIATTDGIAAKEMGDNRYYCAYAKLSDGTYAYSDLYQYSPKKYAINMIGKDTTSDKQKILCVAMLNYGAAAQVYFNYKADDLMNAGLTDAQRTLVTAYDASYFKGAVAADPDKIANFASTDGFTGKSASVSFEGAFAINYYFTPNAAVAGDMKLYIWTPEDYASAGELTAPNASEIVTMERQASGAYWGQVSGIAAKALDDTYYVAGVYTDETGNTCCTGVIAYSLSKYCLKNAEPGKDMQQLAAATAMYGYYAHHYFTT